MQLLWGREWHISIGAANTKARAVHYKLLLKENVSYNVISTCAALKYFFVTKLQIRRGNRDNLVIISLVFNKSIFCDPSIKPSY